MAGLTLTDLPWPEDRYRPDLHSPGFEAAEAAAAEDALRAARLRKRARKRKGKKAARLFALADRLDPEVTTEPPETLASARYMRDERIRVIGAVWKLVTEDRSGFVERIDVLKPGWAMSPEGFASLVPEQMCAELRADLLRAANKLGVVGVANCKGFLMAFLHGEHQEDCDQFHPHFHILASGDWINVVLGLKKQRKYRPTDRVKRPVRRSALRGNIAYALSYLLKSYWPKKWMGHVSGVGCDRRSLQHQRIEEPQHSQVLMWLDQFGIEQTILKLGIRQDADGFKLRKNS